MAQPIVSVVVEHCNYLSSRRFESPSRSKFITFQGEYKGLENKILISGRAETLQTHFVIDVLMYALSRPNFTQRRQWVNPCSLILNIEGATDHYRLKS